MTMMVPINGGGSWTSNASLTTYTLTTDQTSYPVGQLVLQEPARRVPKTEVEQLLGEVDAVCALAR